MKEDWLNKPASELPGLSNRTRNSMKRWKRITVSQLLEQFNRLKPLRLGGPPYVKGLGGGAGKKTVSELIKSLKEVGFGHEDNILLSDNPDEIIIWGLQNKYRINRHEAELCVQIAREEKWISPWRWSTD